MPFDFHSYALRKGNVTEYRRVGDWREFHLVFGVFEAIACDAGFRRSARYQILAAIALQKQMPIDFDALFREVPAGASGRRHQAQRRTG